MNATPPNSFALELTQGFKSLVYSTLEFLKNYDYALFQKINQVWTTTWADQFFPAITDLHKHPAFFIVAPTLVALLLAKKFKFQTVGLMLTLAFCLGWSDYAGGKVKRIIERERPFQVEELQTIQRSPGGKNASFYSNHASNNFAMAAFLSLYVPVASWLFWGIAILVAYSRVYNGVHFPTDILFGALIGIVWGRLFGSLGLRFLPKDLRKKISVERKSA